MSRQVSGADCGVLDRLLIWNSTASSIIRKQTAAERQAARRYLSGCPMERGA
ncbi:MAG: hypothetical protein JSS39_10740 [Nitrospira sp.]|nr:hypothetical protein [Nitrospira sp.]